MRMFLIALALVLLAGPAYAQTSGVYSGSSGNVSIGTNTPLNRLDVYGATAIGTGYAGETFLMP